MDIQLTPVVPDRLENETNQQYVKRLYLDVFKITNNTDDKDCKLAAFTSLIYAGELQTFVTGSGETTLTRPGGYQQTDRWLYSEFLPKYIING